MSHSTTFDVSMHDAPFVTVVQASQELFCKTFHLLDLELHVCSVHQAHQIVIHEFENKVHTAPVAGFLGLLQIDMHVKILVRHEYPGGEGMFHRMQETPKLRRPTKVGPETRMEGSERCGCVAGDL